jgi:acetyl esterase/lipase
MVSFGARLLTWSVLPSLRQRMSTVMWSSANPRPALATLRAQAATYVKYSLSHMTSPQTVNHLVVPHRIAAEVHHATSAPLAANRDVVFALHGGAFVVGSPALYRPLWRRLSEVAQCSVVAPEYPLAPESSLDQMAASIEKSYLALLEQMASEHGNPAQAAQRVVLLGDSAGAHLTALLLLRLHKRAATEKITPRAAILSSPILSFADRWSRAAAARSDPLLPFDDNALQALGGFVLTGFNCFHKDASAEQKQLRSRVLEQCERSALLSPLENAPELVRALPPHLYVTAGGTEGLLPQVQHFMTMVEKRKDMNATLSVRDGLFHSFAAAAENLTESAEEINQWAKFMQQSLNTNTKQ